MPESDVVDCCMICDGGYVDQTIVAIASLTATKKETSAYRIHVIAADLPESQRLRLASRSSGDVEIRVLLRDLSVFGDLGSGAAGPGSMTQATRVALFKFLIPDLFPQLDRILYLDGDLVSRIDLHEIFDLPLGDCWAAVVPDSGTMYFSHSGVRGSTGYFNSGVMLLNLAALRRDRVPARLVEAKKARSAPDLMDQNVFNLVFDGHVRLLPIRYNFMPVNLFRSYSAWSVDDVNGKFGTSYATKRDIFDDAAIVHYSSKDKPWKDPDGPYSFLWRKYWFSSGLADGGGDARSKPEPGRPFVTVVVLESDPASVRETLDSLREQTFGDFETVCADGAPAKGLVSAKGTYVLFLEGGDALVPGTLEELSARVRQNDLDLVLFEGDFGNVPGGGASAGAARGRRKDVYPGVRSGKKMYADLCRGHDLCVSPCLQMVRRDVLLEPSFEFPDWAAFAEDWHFVQVLFASGRCACFTDVFLRRRADAPSGARNGTVGDVPSSDRAAFVAAMVGKIRTHADNEELARALLEHLLFRLGGSSAGDSGRPFPAFGGPETLEAFAAGLTKDGRMVRSRMQDRDGRIRDLLSRNQALVSGRNELVEELKASKAVVCDRDVRIRALLSERSGLKAQNGKLAAENGRLSGEKAALLVRMEKTRLENERNFRREKTELSNRLQRVEDRLRLSSERMAAVQKSLSFKLGFALTFLPRRIFSAARRGRKGR